MVEIYDAHEQGEIVKKWLQQNGSSIIIGLVIAFGGLFGFNQWKIWQLSGKQQAYSEFQAMNEFLTAGQLDAAMANFQNLQDNHAKSPYTSLAALQMGRARVEAKEPDLAVKYYRFVVENGHPNAIRVVARERLARVLLDQKQMDEALKVIQGETEISGFEARYAETRGDIYTALGQNEQAIAAYKEALDVMEEGTGDRAALLLKLEALGVIQEDEETTS